MKLVLFVLDDANKTLDVLNAWKEAGADGATVLFSTGMGRLNLIDALREDLPLMPSLSDFYASGEELNRTLFTILEDDALVEKIIKATEQVVGDLDQPGTGILAVLPTVEVHGLINLPNQGNGKNRTT